VALRVAPRWLRVCDIPVPTTGLEAKFSYRLTSAMAIHGLDTGALDVFSAETCTRRDLVELRDRVDVAGDPAVSDTAAHVRLALAGGTSVELLVDLDAPLPLAQRRDKIAAKVRALLPPNAADAVLALDAGLGGNNAAGMAATLAGLAAVH
jgi:2-methylcitrate dehydratase PrpD